MNWRTLFPGLATLSRYERRWLAPDVTAGLVLTAFLVPVGMGYAQAAGLPPITGLYATIIPLLVYAVLGPSRVMVLGPDSSLAALIAAVVIPLSADDPARVLSLAAALAVFTGALVAVLGVLRFGFVTELLSRPVQLGYLAAVALLIVTSQTPKLFGISTQAEGIPGQITELVRAIVDGRSNLPSLAIGVAGMLVIIVVKRVAPRIPGAFVAVVLGIVVSEVLALESKGVRALGGLPRGFPMPSLPILTLADIPPLLSGAVGIALVAVADTTVLSKALSSARGEETQPNQELVALGAANVAAGLFGGFPISSSASRTPVAIDAGARTQVTGIVGAAAITAMLLAAPTVLRGLPQPVLSGIVLVAASGLVTPSAVLRLYRASRVETGLFAAAFVGVAFIGVIEGIFLAVLLSLGDFVRRAWRPHDAVLGHVSDAEGYHDVTRFPRAKKIPGLALYRFDAPLFFANAEHFRQRIRELVAEHAELRWVVVAAEPITDIDTTAAEILEDLLSELHDRNVTLVFAELKDPVKDRLRRFGLFDRIGAKNFHPVLEAAVRAFNGDAASSLRSSPPNPRTPGRAE